jgi:glucose-6-phosphate 1-dehydrogenase
MAGSRDEGTRTLVILGAAVNGEGDPFTLEPVTLEGVYGRGDLLEYGQVLRGVLEGEAQLPVGGDAAVESWRIGRARAGRVAGGRGAAGGVRRGYPGPQGRPV